MKIDQKEPFASNELAWKSPLALTKSSINRISSATFICVFGSVMTISVTGIVAALAAVGYGLDSRNRGFGFVPGGPFVMNCTPIDCYGRVRPPECNPSDIVGYSARENLFTSGPVVAAAILTAICFAAIVMRPKKEGDQQNKSRTDQFIPV